jgi:hypothetical protein
VSLKAEGFLALAMLVAGARGIGTAAPEPEPHPIRIEVPKDALAPPPLVVFHGNVLFHDFFYRSLLDLPKDATATPAVAQAVATKLGEFLRRAGYDLATVQARVEGDQIVVEIDEGQLDKVVVIGQGFVKTIRSKLEISLPFNVFNRPFLEERLRELGRRYPLNQYSYELAPVVAPAGSAGREEKDEFGFYNLRPLLGIPAARPGQRYELHIFIASPPGKQGVSPDVEIGSPEGLGVGARYGTAGLLLKEDRLELLGRVAGAIRSNLDTSSSKPVLSRLLGQARWFSSPILGQTIRPELTVRANLWQLQRSDLRLNNYSLSTFSSSLDANMTFRPGLALSLGLGLERRLLYNIQKAIDSSPLVDQTPKGQTRPYVEAVLDAIFNPAELRTDRKHRLNVETNYYTGSTSSGTSYWLRVGYQRYFPIGWHELWIQAHGTLLGGQVLFVDEEPIGRHMHGPFGASEFATRLASNGVEFRYSIVRDLLKLGIFYDQVIYGGIDRLAGTQTLRFAGSGGLALHLLVADEFQCDLYFGAGVTTGGVVEYAPALSLRQVF